MDNPGADDIANDQGGQLDLKFNVREPPEHVLHRLQQHAEAVDNEKIRQAIAMGIDRQRIVDNFYPAGSEVATHFTPCDIPFGCEGDATWDFDLDEAKAPPGRGHGFAEGITSLDTKLSFRDGRPRLPAGPARRSRTEIASAAEANLGIDADARPPGVRRVPRRPPPRASCDGIYMLGWGADYPDPTNFLDYHFGAGSGKKFGKPFDDIAAALTKGATVADRRGRAKAAYAEANNLIKQHVPAVIVAHGASGTAFKADVEDAHTLAARQRGLLGR